MLAPAPVKFDTFIAHSHYFRLYVRLGAQDEAYALCDCGAELTHEHIESIVNGRQLEVQFFNDYGLRPDGTLY